MGTQRERLTGADIRRHHRTLCDAIEVLHEIEGSAGPANPLGMRLVADCRARLQMIAECVLYAEKKWKQAKEQQERGSK